MKSKDLRLLEQEAREERRKAYLRGEVKRGRTWGLVSIALWKARKAIEREEGGEEKNGSTQ